MEELAYDGFSIEEIRQQAGWRVLRHRSVGVVEYYLLIGHMLNEYLPTCPAGTYEIAFGCRNMDFVKRTHP